MEYGFSGETKLALIYCMEWSKLRIGYKVRANEVLVLHPTMPHSVCVLPLTCFSKHFALEFKSGWNIYSHFMEFLSIYIKIINCWEINLLKHSLSSFDKNRRNRTLIGMCTWSRVFLIHSQAHLSYKNLIYVSICSAGYFVDIVIVVLVPMSRRVLEQFVRVRRLNRVMLLLHRLCCRCVYRVCLLVSYSLKPHLACHICQLALIQWITFGSSILLIFKDGTL